MTILNPVQIIQAISVLFSVNCKLINTFYRHKSLSQYKSMGFILVLLMLFISSMGTAFAAGNYNTGAFYFANGDYNTALQIWAPLAQEGNPAAQYSIGLLYDQGKGVKKDPQTALKYFQAAIKQNLPAAQYYLGVKYYAGLGVKKSPSKALDLVTRAAEQDHLQAQFQLAYFYDRGIGTPVNLKKATQWYTRAAENGFGPAQHALAARYLTGRGTSLNLEQGVFWLEKAADQNDMDAMRDLGFLYYQGMGVKKDWTRARKLLLDPADEGSALAQYVLGEIYAQGGHGITQNISQARHWYSKARQSGNSDAAKRLKELSAVRSADSHKKPAAAKTVSNVKQKSQTKSAPAAINHLDNQRFAQLNNNDYTIQILQAQYFQSIRKLIDQYRDRQTYVLKIKRNNKPFYVLSYGSFTDYAQAKQMAENLPEALQLKSSPWIRKTGQLKQLLE